MIFIGMAFSFSQTSFMALAAGVWVLSFLAWRRVVAVAAGLAVLLVAVGVAISQPQVVDALNHSLDKASSSRASLAERGSETFGAHPVAGVGLGGFGAATGKTDFEKRHIAPHNIVVDVASELGIVGIGLFLALLTTVAVALRRVPVRRACARSSPPISWRCWCTGWATTSSSPTRRSGASRRSPARVRCDPCRRSRPRRRQP